ncbi:MAG: hypothetical protein J3R72DRAFT_382238, partial [Linnemannia gamsii]
MIRKTGTFSAPDPEIATQVRPTGSKGMMQAYGYFVWFAAQRIKPGKGVVCMITASQWLTLEFAVKLRAWLFENCLMDEFFQFEPYKVFSKVQTDSLIFKIRAIPPDLLPSSTSTTATSSCSSPPHMSSSSSSSSILLPLEAPAAPVATYTYSFAPMMPASVLTTYMLALTQDLGAICSAGTKKMNRLRAVEPLLWHRGPNTNPVYGLVVRMEYARAMFGGDMTSRWFRPALYWNGKNSPEGKALHREGQFWQGRDRQRLSKKEGSPAESYCVPTSDPQRMYALCMVDKESVKVLRQQVGQKVEGAQALWNYLTDVRSHFQPGLASKRKVTPSSGKAQAADVPEKIVHPINYGYFSKTQPRQRFFLDTDSLA